MQNRPLALAILAACAEASAPPPTIETVAGRGAPGYDGEGLAARESALYAPVDVDFDAEGRALIVDWNNHRVRAIQASGALDTVLGTGVEDYGAPNQPATRFAVHHPLDLVVSREGTWAFAGYHDPRVLEVDLQGVVRARAGIGQAGDAGDGGPATLAFLDAPSAVVFGADGELFVADELRHRVRRVTADRRIEAFAGASERGYSGDGGPAMAARFDGPVCLAYDRGARALYVCDANNHAVRRVAADGTIETIAGTGRAGFGGDGGPARAAELNRPFDVVLLDDGAMLIADSENHRIRRIDADGIIETLVGSSTAAFSGDGGPAREAGLRAPWGINVDALGQLWIADSGNHRVRRAEAGLLGAARVRP